MARWYGYGAAALMALACCGGPAQGAVQVSYDVSVSGFESWSGNDSNVGTGAAHIEYSRFGNQQVIINGTGWNASAMADVDLAAGTLKTWAYGLSVSDRDSDPIRFGACDVSSSLRVTDTLHFAEDTWVTLRGRLDGYFSARTSSSDGGWTRAGVDLEILILNFNATGEQDIQALSFKTSPYATEIYGGGATATLPTPETPDVDTPIEVRALIPAGEMQLRIDMMSWVNTESYLESWLDYASSQGHSDFSNTATFELLVPEGAVVTSGSGLVPITAVPEPSVLGLLALGAGALMRRSRSR